MITETRDGRYKVRDERATECEASDFTLWRWSKCHEPATKVIIEGEDFHYAHFCDSHAELAMARLNAQQLVVTVHLEGKELFSKHYALTDPVDSAGKVRASIGMDISEVLNDVVRRSGNS